MLYNLQLIKLAGENGVAAYGVVMYVSFMFIAVFLGYSIGCAPVISFHYGAGHQEELRRLFKKSLVLMSVFSVALTILAELLARPFSALFVGYDPILLEMTIRAFVLYSLSYLLTGFNIFGSAFFTALNDGLTSAIISFLRTLVFQTAVVLLLPLLLPQHLKLDGIWFSITLAEALSLAVTFFFILKNRRKYGYA